MIDTQLNYYKGCKKSSKYSNNEYDIKFYEDAKRISKDSISSFIEQTELHIDKLSEYLKQTQKGKVYMLVKNNKFYIEHINIDDYEIKSYVKQPDKSLYIATTTTNHTLKILLRWKNGNGIAYPAFQIS
jgi:hypothetical protein